MSTPYDDGGMFQLGMADDAAIRRTNFRKLWPEKFSPTEAALKLGSTPAQWSDLYHGRKSFGEKLARQIEEKLSLVRLSLDDPEGPAIAPVSAELADRLAKLPAEDRLRAENVLRTMLGMEPLQPPATSRKQRQAA